MNAVRRTDELLAKRAQARAHVWFLPPLAAASTTPKMSVLNFKARSQDTLRRTTTWKFAKRARATSGRSWDIHDLKKMSGLNFKARSQDTLRRTTTRRYLFPTRLEDTLFKFKFEIGPKTAWRKLHGENCTAKGTTATSIASCCLLQDLRRIGMGMG